jgi:membrane protease YdiL (CAAX protease family)
MSADPPAPPRTAAIAALAVVGLAFVVNAFLNHTARGLGVKAIPGLYPLAFFIGLGTLLPAWLLGKLLLAGAEPRTLGLGFGRRDAIACLIALVAGGLLAFPPVAPLLRYPAGVELLHGLFASLLVASTAEVLLFLGVLAPALRALMGRGDDWQSRIAVAIASSLAFGLFHFTYPEPWDTLPVAATLSVIWFGTSLLFVLGRSLAAAILFDNLMATSGFVRNGLSLPLPPIQGWSLAALALAGFLVVLRFSRR